MSVTPSRSAQQEMLKNYGMYKARVKESLSRLMSNLAHIDASNVGDKQIAINSILSELKRCMDAFYAANQAYAPMGTLIMDLKRKIVKRGYETSTFAYTESDVVVFDSTDRYFLEIFGAKLDLPKRRSYDLDYQLNSTVSVISEYVDRVSEATGMRRIDEALVGINNIFDDLVFCNREGIPEKVLKNIMIFKLKNMILGSGIVPVNEHVVRMIQHLNSAFKTRFGFDLNISTQISEVPDIFNHANRRNTRGPSDGLSKPGEEAAGPRGIKPESLPSGGVDSVVYNPEQHFALLSSFHQRLIALEQQHSVIMRLR
jgi:hypothetical protein